jgi:Glycosyltransferases involved in cell wall biogenesis
VESRKKIAIVIPAYNEEDNVEIAYKRLKEVLDSTNYDYELIFVDDGSKDNTLSKLLELYEKDKKVKVISLSRNFGKEIALSAGLDYADADAVIPFDVDLQDPPEVIPKLIAKFQEGYDVVNAVRIKREGETFLKRFTSKAFYKIINILSDIEIPQDVGDFRLISKAALNAVKQIRERKRFMKGIFAWVGFKTTSVYYERAPRHAGKTKWNYFKLINLAIEGITSFSIAPLRLASLLGLFVSFVAFLYAMWIIIQKLVYGNPVKGYPSIMVAILFLGGVQLITIGIIGEYVGRIYEEVKQRPLYIVKKIWDKDNKDNKDK